MRVRIILVWVVVGFGCIGDEKSDARDPNKGSMCDPTGMFDAPLPLAGFATVKIEDTPRLTADELELYLSFTDRGNINMAQRSTKSEPFGAPIALSNVNTSANEYGPSVSSDGLMLFFASDRVSGEGYHIYVSTRTSRLSEFGAPSAVANVNSSTVTDDDIDPL